jgi:hypothetical protein
MVVQRAEYDSTGKIVRTVEEEFMDGFAGGEDSVFWGMEAPELPPVGCLYRQLFAPGRRKLPRQDPGRRR